MFTPFAGVQKWRPCLRAVNAAPVNTASVYRRSLVTFDVAAVCCWCRCGACTRASWRCVWYVRDNQCRDSQAINTTGGVIRSDVRVNLPCSRTKRVCCCKAIVSDIAVFVLKRDVKLRPAYCKAKDEANHLLQGQGHTSPRRKLTLTIFWPFLVIYNDTLQLMTCRHLVTKCVYYFNNTQMQYLICHYRNYDDFGSWDSPKSTCAVRYKVQNVGYKSATNV